MIRKGFHMAFFGILLLFIRNGEAWCQYTIRGSISDPDNKPVRGARVFIKESYDFVYTSAAGHFEIPVARMGSYIIVAEAEDNPAVETPVIVGSDSSGYSSLAIELKHSGKRLADVIVRASTTSVVSDRNKAEVMNRIDVLTTAGANADITAALKTLPGTQQSLSQDGLFVRGGQGSETQVYVDGLIVNNFYYSGAPDVNHRGRFPPSLFKGNFFSSGGYSAQYGQALSSVLVLETEALPVKSSMDVNIGSVGVSATANILSKNGNSSYGGSLSYLNLTPYFGLIKQRYDFIRVPAFTDGNYFFRIRTNNGGMIKLFTSFSANAVSLYRPDIDYANQKEYYSVTSRNVYSNISFTQPLKNNWTLDCAASYAYNSGKYKLGLIDSTESGSYLDSLSRNSSVQFKTTIRKRASKLLLTSGIESQYYKPNLYLDSTNVANYGYSDLLSAVFTEGTYEFSKNINLRLGARAEYSTLLHRTSLAPRAMLDLRLPGNFHANFAFGQFYQKPEDEVLLYRKDLNFLKASHYIAGIQKTIPNAQTFRVEAFYKKYDRLTVVVPDTTTNGYGYAYGFELFWRKKIPDQNLEYWISYSYLNSKRKFWDYPIYTQPSFVTNHSLSLVAKRFFDKISTHIALSYTYETGRPYYNPGKPNALYLSDRTNDYHNLNLSIAHVRNIKKIYSIFVLTVSNVLNNNQVFGYRYSDINYSVREPVTPLANHFIYLGAFFSLGIDRTTDEFNRNL